jgi:hypothetical protein
MIERMSLRCYPRALLEDEHKTADRAHKALSLQMLRRPSEPTLMADFQEHNFWQEPE